jgi:S-adenosylmethionine hydrolase
VDFVNKPLPQPETQGAKVIGSVLRIDKYGNIITNLRRSHLRPDCTLRVAGMPVTRLCATFAEAGPGEFVAVEGSTGFIEIALNQGSAAARLKVDCMAEIEVESGTANH